MAAEVHCGGDAFRTGQQRRLVASGCDDVEGRDSRQQPRDDDASLRVRRMCSVAHRQQSNVEDVTRHSGPHQRR
jgi:hypothetical protein